MTIHAFLLCYNEADIIRHSLNHYSSFCDNITIFDNESTDDSVEIITKHFPEVEIKSFNSDNEFRDDLHQNIKNNCWKDTTSDYVIVADMDELLYANNLPEKLKEIDRLRPAFCSVIGYEMFSETFPKDYSKPITSQVKNGCRNHRFDKAILFNTKKVKDMNFTPGAHEFDVDLVSPEEPVPLVEIKLLHYKYLDRKLVLKKNLHYEKRLSTINIKLGWGKEYRRGKRHITRQFNDFNNRKIQVIID